MWPHNNLVAFLQKQESMDPRPRGDAVVRDIERF